MIWSKTFAKIGWFLLYNFAGWLGMLLTSSEFRATLGDNPILVPVALALGALCLTFRDWWKHREPAAG